MLKCKSAVSYASNVSKYTEWKQQDSEHTVFFIYIKKIYTYMLTSPTSHKKNHLEELLTVVAPGKEEQRDGRRQT